MGAVERREIKYRETRSRVRVRVGSVNEGERLDRCKELGKKGNMNVETG